MTGLTFMVGGCRSFFSSTPFWVLGKHHPLLPALLPGVSTCHQVAMLKKHREVTEAELRRTQSELQTQQAQRVQIQSEEELAKRRIQEELRQAPSGENGEMMVAVERMEWMPEGVVMYFLEPLMRYI